MMLYCRGWPPSAEAQLGGMLIASEFTNGLPHQVLDIAEVHIGGTLRAGQLERAATLCASYLGRRPELWQRWIRAFGAAGALPQLAPHVPLSNPQLPQETYEQVKTRL